MNEWISIEDEKPIMGVAIDIYSTCHGRLCNYHYIEDFANKKGNNFFEPLKSGVCVVRDATHWMPLPEPPEKVE